MAKTLQLRRYTTSNLASITGASGELIVDTTLNAITVHTGSKAGGFYAANAITLQAAFNQANAAYAQANTDLTYLASNVAIILGIDVTQNNTGNLAFAQANAAYGSQNTTGVYANAAFTQANVAYTRANNSVNANTGGTITGDLTVTGNLIISNTATFNGTLTPTLSANGNTSSYATKHFVEYNPASKALTYSSTPDASSPYITGYSAEIHVSPVALNDSGRGTIGDPVKTIVRAQALAALAFETTGVGQRKSIILHPGDYAENVTINTQYTVLTTHELIGKNTTLSGTLTLATGCTVDGLKMNNLVISGTSANGSIDLIGCTVSTAATKTSSAYTVFRGCDLSSSSLNITGSGSVVMVGGNYSTVTVNNAAAGVLTKAVITMGPVTLTAGTMQISDTLVYAATNSSNAITQSAGSVLTLNNSQTLIPDLTNVARNSFGGFYSISHSVYDKANSTFGGTSLSANSYSQYINADRLILASGGQVTFSDATVQTTAWTGAASVYANAAFLQANTAATTIPQNPQTTNYVLQLSDAGKHIYYTQASNTTLYIPTTSNVAFSNGTTIMIVSKTTSGANVTVSPNTGVTMYLAGNTTSISRNVTTYGMATLIQVAANTWFINGTGVA
jgi:hypothetical protein